MLSLRLRSPTSGGPPTLRASVLLAVTTGNFSIGRAGYPPVSTMHTTDQRCSQRWSQPDPWQMHACLKHAPRPNSSFKPALLCGAA